MNKALFNIFGFISALLAIGCFANNSIALGVILCIVAFALFAIGKKKSQAPAQVEEIVSVVKNPVYTPQIAPVVKAHAPTYKKVLGSKVLQMHYKKDGIYTPENIDISALKLYEPVRFEFEPTNQYDPNAIKVIAGASCIGYLYKNRQGIVRSYMQNDDSHVFGHVSSIENGKVKIDEVFYKSTAPLFVCSLNGEKAADCDKEDLLDIEYDSEKDIYKVCTKYNDGYCGKIPKSQADELDESRAYIGIVLDVTESGAKIAVFETADD